MFLSVNALVKVCMRHSHISLSDHRCTDVYSLLMTRKGKEVVLCEQS